MTIDGELPASILAVHDGDRLTCPNPITYELSAKIVRQSLLVEGRVRTQVECQCDRCLTQYTQAIENSAICHYCEIPDDKIVDLTEEIREDIIVEVPPKFLCSPRCAGICPSCGANLNTERCHCAAPQAGADDWHPLDQLTL